MEWGWLWLVRGCVSVLIVASINVHAILAVWRESVQKFSGPSDIWVSCGQCTVTVNNLNVCGFLYLPGLLTLWPSLHRQEPQHWWEIQESGFSDPANISSDWSGRGLHCWYWGRAHPPKLWGEGYARTRTVGRCDFPRGMVNMDFHREHLVLNIFIKVWWHEINWIYEV